MVHLFFTLWFSYFLFRLNVYGATYCKNCSIYQNPISRIFARKKRFIVFPNYAAMKITVATGKSLIAIYPKGVNLSLEASVYYPLPTVLEEWYPKKYRSSTTPKPKPSPRRRKKPTTKNPAQMHQIASMQMNNPMDMAMQMHHIPLHSESGVFWMPDSGWSTNINSTLGSIGSMNKMKSWSRGDDFYSKHYQPNYAPSRTWNRQENYKYLPNKQYSYLKNKPWTHHLNKGLYSSKIHPNWDMDDNNYNQPINYSPEFDSYEDWKYFRAHRERRDIYDHFETFTSKLGIDIKSCILRSICETKRYLLPPGYSLIQDILRIVFSLPTLDGLIDEYSKAMRNDENDCRNSYRKVCPISLLDLILNPDKIKF